MKKKYIIFTTLFALFITFGLLTASVFAALKVDFGINNTISFYGGMENVKFTINAEVHGTLVREGEEIPHTYREYDYNKATSSLLNQWVIGSLEFDPNAEEVCVEYQFEINNIGAPGDLGLLAYIQPINIDTRDLQEPEIIGTKLNPIEIATGTQGMITLKLKPVSSMGFVGARTCDFNVIIEPIENN